MKLYAFLFPLLTLTFLSGVSTDETAWKFKKEKRGIKVYIRDAEDSKIKELKITLEVNASLSSVLSAVNDVQSYPNWVYRNISSEVLVKDGLHVVYYGKTDFPWPMDDRDYIMDSRVWQDENGVAYSKSNAIWGTDYKAIEKKVVRVPQMISDWTFTPKGNGVVNIEYYLKSDPGGLLPPWLINMAIDQGPIQTMEAFREIVNSPKYKDAKLAWLK